jgi:hypothetical protein
VPGIHLPQCDGQIAGKPGFAGHQVIPPRGKFLLFSVIAYGEELSFLIVKNAQIHSVRESLRSPGQRSLSPLIQRLPQGDQASLKISAVHSRDIPWL